MWSSWSVEKFKGNLGITEGDEGRIGNIVGGENNAKNTSPLLFQLQPHSKSLGSWKSEQKAQQRRREREREVVKVTGGFNTAGEARPRANLAGKFVVVLTRWRASLSGLSSWVFMELGFGFGMISGCGFGVGDVGLWRWSFGELERVVKVAN
ncbi:hypothetical protein HPP92_006216 [Vanilla planifolia]|uniref:Uncharacterized protein n=1 Tax=Vanilla planifolia TaxID=51239 RepID=A0A835VD02_VANPL|nr:hypothetical protein HPP92_006216 [Vanilla planifolia]